ncbi:MAG: carboxylating nicotinate-nucleotide diphosphorylase [Cryomorphaceae bacterium]|nr:carboxylating nicotinate-nucleotide diphosphorylase [Cryomorphaceae bacterium]
MTIANQQLQAFIETALREDLGDGDHSSLSCIPANTKGRAVLIVKEAGVICGIDVAKAIFQTIESDIAFHQHLSDGNAVEPGDVAFEVEGHVHTILAGERLALNCMQRMSGVSSYTRKLQDMISHTNCVLLDTRKTTPGMRMLEKYAVRCGGGGNHRMGLYDMIMLKDNHIDYAGGITHAIEKVKSYLKTNNLSLAVEVEARNLQEVEEILSSGKVDRIMLDNFLPQEVKLAVDLIDKRSETEASGGITESNIVAYAETGVDFISVGALTHSVKSLDMSLKAR